jgi:xanthine dehydrogenase YagR molybdenum-binding subunit
MQYIGKEMRRVEGLAKVTGQAKYAAEFELPNMAYGYFKQSTIAKGSITKIDLTEASKSPGVLTILTHENVPKLLSPGDGGKPEKGAEFSALRSPKIVFNGQPIAVVVADTFEQARAAANLIRVDYDKKDSDTDMTRHLDEAKPTNPEKAPAERGNFQKAFDVAPVTLEAEYHIPIEHHNPIEIHGSTAFWKEGKLRIFDKTQDIYQLRDRLAKMFGVKEEDVEVIALFVGGAFGSCLSVHYHSTLAALAAREVERPVQLILSRRQSFTGYGYRPDTWQRISLAAEKDGKLTALSHRVVINRSSCEDYSEDFFQVSRALYQCPNVETIYQNVVTDMQNPTPMRAPGAVSQMVALECGLDELSYKLKMDPLELRLVNYAEKDPETGKPFSSKALRECYRMGAEKFGWKDRKPEPRSMKDGRLLVGWGMATGIWPALQMKASADVTLLADGTARVTSATTDIGPGTYTVMTIIAAEHLGLAPEKIRFELGDSRFPKAPSQGGSWTTASVGSAIYGAADAIKKRLLELAAKDADSPLAGAKAEDVVMLEGKLQRKEDAAKAVSYIDLLKKNKLEEIKEVFEAKPSPERENYVSAAHGAQFVEVKVDPDLGTTTVTRVIEVTACGKIMNPKTSHSQEIGGVVWGMGMALEEASEVDHRYGRIMNASLESYHVPVHADVHHIETIFVEEEDKIVNPLGVKGMGELGMVGIPAAILNAIYHATGVRVRNLPATPDKILAKA